MTLAAISCLNQTHTHRLHKMQATTKATNSKIKLLLNSQEYKWVLIISTRFTKCYPKKSKDSKHGKCCQSKGLFVKELPGNNDQNISQNFQAASSN